MRLKLRFLSRARLWSEVVVCLGVEVFVPTTADLEPDERVEVEVELPEQEVPVLAHATVVARRPLTPTHAAGVLVTFDADAVELCRALVGEHAQARLVGRAELRVDCDLPTRVLNEPAQDGVARSLSLHGLTLRTARPLAQGARVRLTVQLPDGTELTLLADVLWAREELSLSGVHFVELTPEAQFRLSGALETLGRPTVAPEAQHTVLVADDDTSILDFTSRVVARAGHRVVRAERGDVALELARRERPALALLDVLMPGLDGLEVCRAIRADAALAKLPVVLLSAMGEDRLASAVKSSGASGYLTKPMRVEALRGVLASYLPET